MDSELPDETAARIRVLAAEGRALVEGAVNRRSSQANRLRITLLRVVGALAIGLLAAGLSILATVVLLNLVMHFSPT